MSSDLPSERPKSIQPKVLVEPEGYQIAQTLEQVIEKIGQSRVPLTNWWEAFSHGLSMPVHGNPGSDRGLLRRCKNAARYLEMETDFLHFDDEGFFREEDGDPTGKPIEIGHDERFKSLVLRVAAFQQTRNDLLEQGFFLPDNPEIGRAIEAIQAHLEKRPQLQTACNTLFGNQQSSFRTRALDERRKPGLPDL